MEMVVDMKESLRTMNTMDMVLRMLRGYWLNS